LNRKNILIALVLIAALLLVGCSAKDAPAPAVPEGAQTGELTGLKGCEYQPAGSKTKYAAECGTLVVPENWEVADSRLIALPVVRIPAAGQTPPSQFSCWRAVPANQTCPGSCSLGCLKSTMW